MTVTERFPNFDLRSRLPDLDIRRRLLHWGLQKSDEGWLLIQSGNSYDLEPLEYEPDAGAYKIERDGEERYFEDPAGKMRQMDGIPIGMAHDDSRIIVDAATAKTATALSQKVEDRGALDRDEEIPVEEIENSLKLGTLQTAQGPAHFVNPFHREADEPSVFDLSRVVNLLGHDVEPDTPRKSAENALAAERATQGLALGELTTWIKFVGSFLMGAIAVEYIANSSGGGGVEVPLTLSPILDQSLTTLLVLL